jgi:NADH-quinone oxidoreductase subunit J
VIGAESTGGLTDLILFWVFAPISVGAALAMLFARRAVHSALFLIVNFFCLAVFFLVLGSPFLFAVQIIVYAGAIMVLFLFVIMLLGVASEESLVERMKAQRPLAILLGLGLAAEVFFAIRLGVGVSTRATGTFAAVNKGGNVRALARVLFNGYFFPFEATSVLLIIAAVAAMVIASRRTPFEAPGTEPIEAGAPAREEETVP